MTSEITVTKATDKDLHRFYGVHMPFPWDGIVAKRGDLILGIGGIYIQDTGPAIGFMDIGKWMRKPIVFRHVIMYLRELKGRGIDCIEVQCDRRFAKAERFLVRLGFSNTGKVKEGMEVWQWGN